LSDSIKLNNYLEKEFNNIHKIWNKWENHNFLFYLVSTQYLQLFLVINLIKILNIKYIVNNLTYNNLSEYV
jgi:hypothetical protein